MLAEKSRRNASLLERARSARGPQGDQLLVPILDVARALGLAVKQVGGAYYTACPVTQHEHDDRSPRCQLGGEKPHLWYCHKCGEAGDAVRLVQEIRKWGTGEAFQWLRDHGFLPQIAGARRTYLTALHELADRRGWTVEALQALGCTSKGDMVVFPMRDAEGKTVGRKLRRKDNKPIRHKAQEVKSLTEAESKNGLIYPRPLPESEDPVLVCEGEAEAAAALSAGWRPVVGTAGANLGKVGRHALQALLRGRDCVLAPHPDQDGAKWLDEVGGLLRDVQAEVRYIASDGKDLDERLRPLANRGAELRRLIEEAFSWEDQASSYSSASGFAPTLLAREIARRRTLAFGFDPESGGGRLMEYSKGVWHPADMASLKALARKLFGLNARRYHADDAVAALACEVTRIAWCEWNRERRLINCPSGMLDPMSEKLKPHDPKCYSTFQVPVRWNPDARCDLVDRFLSEVLAEDCLELIYEMMGYLLVPVLYADKLFILLGEANTGKTTFLEAFLGMLSMANWALVTLQDLAENRFAPARLENKLLGTFDDLDSLPLKSVSRLKALTGGFPMLEVERKGQDAYKAPLYARLLFTCNRMPRSPDKTSAWYRRLVLIPFANVIEEARQDKSLGEKLAMQEARERLFALAVGGLQALIRNDWQFPEPKSVIDMVEGYKLENDSVAAFLKESCVVGPGNEVTRGEWYEQYKRWCENAGLHPVVRKTAYGRLRSEYGCRDGQLHTGVRVFKGIGLVGS